MLKKFFLLIVVLAFWAVEAKAQCPPIQSGVRFVGAQQFAPAGPQVLVVNRFGRTVAVAPQQLQAPLLLAQNPVAPVAVVPVSPFARFGFGFGRFGRFGFNRFGLGRFGFGFGRNRLGVVF